MAWSDAARAAALESRRRNVSFSGKKLHPTTWYHVGGPRKGLYTHGVKDFAGLPARVWSSNALAQTRRSYGKGWQPHGKTVPNIKALVHIVQQSSAPLRNARSYKHSWRTGNKANQTNLHPWTDYTPQKNHFIDQSRTVRFRTKQAPKAKGRASRGHY